MRLAFGQRPVATLVLSTTRTPSSAPPHADDVPPAFQNRPAQAVCDNAVPTIAGSGTIFGGPGRT
ncbi:hypothetical protein BBK82_45820 [Lentzea guizhouensis]|uniref:Uncharacterized protein n=1 Tax=Lentzea guizhouensis TaxID=1586287 RepID=A0A1B2HWS1_9PSEU|nr:hypothetical protein BBK82_45820 [Lentzea guizhouensis]